MIECDGGWYATRTEAARILTALGGRGRVTSAMIRDWERRGLIDGYRGIDGRVRYVLRHLRTVERRAAQRGRRRAAA